MATAALEYEMESMPEYEGTHEAEWESESESEQFFGALANLARSGASWLTAAGSPQRRFALWAARQALNRGLPAIGRIVAPNLGSNANTGSQLGARAASWLGGMLPQQESEYEWEIQGEINPVRKWYPDAMLEHLGHASAEAESEAEAEALAGAMIPIAARAVPRAAAALTRATPGLVCGLAGVVRVLRRDPATRPLLRVIPAIVRGTAVSVARQSAGGRTVSPRNAVRALARQTFRVLGSPRQATQAFRRSQQLDRRLHGRVSAGSCPHCRRCAAKVR
jgi:hypothetical protein